MKCKKGYSTVGIVSLLEEKGLYGVIIQSTRHFRDATGAIMYKCCSRDGVSGQTVTGSGNFEIFCTVFQRVSYRVLYKGQNI